MTLSRPLLASIISGAEPKNKLNKRKETVIITSNLRNNVIRTRWIGRQE
jgi:hypothetical protein